MNIIDHSSDNIRQIVPQDLSFLSDADQQICSAIHSILAALLGGTGNEPIVLQGCEITSVNPVSDQHTVQTYRISDGLILTDNGIYEFTGEEYSRGFITIAQVGVSSITTAYNPYIILNDQSVAPSPVYGESLQLDQYPHRRLTASLFQEIATTTNGTTTYPNGQAPAGSISLSSLKRIPALGQFC